MFSSLMGTFDFSTPNHQVYAMSSRHVLTGRFISFCMYYFDDLWTIPSPTLSWEGHSHVGMAMSLSVTKIAYQAFLNSSTNPDLVPSPADDEDLVSRLMWDTSLSCSHDFLDGTFLLDESIIEAMNGSNNPWDDMHHRYYFLPKLERINQDEFRYLE
jgi:hypothetical protein